MDGRPDVGGAPTIENAVEATLDDSRRLWWRLLDAATTMRDGRACQRVHENRLSFFAIMVLVFALSPFAEEGTIWAPLLFLGMLLGVSRSLSLRASVQWTLQGLGILGVGLHLVTLGVEPAAVGPFRIAAASIYVVFLGAFLLLLGAHVFRQRHVSMDTLSGAVALYFLMGILWSMLYAVVAWYEPGSFSVEMTNHADFTYFSFATLTTLGYGDIVPVTEVARNLTVLESTVGQIYLTVLVARLVGLHLHHKTQG